MALSFPKNRSEIDNRIKTDIQTELQESNPFLRASFLAALASGNAGRFFEIYIQINKSIQECFPTTADGEFLDTWGFLAKVTRNPGASSKGVIVYTGAPGSVLPVSTTLTSNSQLQIATTNAGFITDRENIIKSLTRSGNVVTAITELDSVNLVTGLPVTVFGASPDDYNGFFNITVTGNNSFTYNIDTTPVSPATGAIIKVAAEYGFSQVESVNVGVDTNTDGGTQFTLDSPIAGVDSPATVQFEGLTGGTDVESDSDYRSRIIFDFQNPSTPFNNNAIIKLAKEVPGVTRVFIRNPELNSSDPEPGQVVIQFVRDNDDQIIPNASEIKTVKDKILTIKPAHTVDEDVIVRAPTPKIVDFQFISITPDSQTMRDSITESLKAFFIDNVTLGEDIIEEAYKCAIFGTVDPQTGETVKNFQLLTPIGDIVISQNELPIIGNVVFP